MKSVGMHLSSDRSLRGFSLLSCYHISCVLSALIETQDLFFKQYKVECFIEVGSSPTLTDMATCILKAKYGAKDDLTGHIRQVFCASKDQKEIYYQFEDEPEATSESDAPANAANPS